MEYFYILCHDNIRIVLENIFGKMTDRHTTICLHVIVIVRIQSTDTKNFYHAVLRSNFWKPGRIFI